MFDWILNSSVVPRRGAVLETCPHMTISAFQWYPTQINGYKFRGRNADFFQLPDALLAVPAGLAAECSNLSRIQLTEFKTDHWFLTNDTTEALNGKVGKIRTPGCSCSSDLQGAPLPRRDSFHASRLRS